MAVQIFFKILVYNEARLRLRKVAFSAFLLAVSLYILLPTVDEIFIHPVFGLFLSIVLNVHLVYGVLLSIVIYRSIGFACLLIALLIGGKPIYINLKERFRKKEIVKKNQEND
jgi:acyl-CoA synthetase (AMP-forming)/AMP-acid ligase II